MPPFKEVSDSDVKRKADVLDLIHRKLDNKSYDQELISSSSVVRRNRNAVLHTYKHGFTGFAARMSEREAEAMRKTPGVVSVFRDPMVKLHTTHSWDFLVSQTSVKIDANPKSDPPSSSQPSDTIIGILDTGKSNNMHISNILYSL